MRFTGNAERFSISLPGDMVKYYRDRAKQEDRPLSTVIRRDLESAMMNRAASKVADK